MSGILKAYQSLQCEVCAEEKMKFPPPPYAAW